MSDAVENTSGEYFSDCGVASTSRAAKDAKLASDLWSASSRIVQLEPHEELPPCAASAESAAASS